MKALASDDPDTVGEATFDQLLEHDDPSKGTFEQRYWWDASHWKGPGSPVFLFNAGEDSADGYMGYLTNKTIPGLYAQQFGGAVILIEHRYWGKSIPFKTLTAETLQYHDLPNAVKDMTYFARNVKLEFDDSKGGANADKAPWVLIGGSYPGALAAWTSVLDPGTFWAYHASSAVVQTITHFWQYFEPVEEALPKNCSNDLKVVVGYVDHVLANGSDGDKAALKKMFGLEMLTHDDDFAEQITTGVWQWQSDSQEVVEFCDYIETYSNTQAVNTFEGGVGLGAALPAVAAWINATSGKTCRQYNCDTYNNPSAFNRPNDLDTGRRQWDWLLCHNPFSWWQTGPPTSDGSSIVSTFLTPQHWQRQCPLMFPETNGFVSGSEHGWTAEHLNMYTGGWDADFKRVLFVNGQFDPWRSASIASEFRPGGPRASTADAPSFIIRNGIHCPDLVIDDVPEELDVLDDILAAMGGWLKEWK